MQKKITLLLGLITLISNAQEVTTIFNEVNNSTGLAVDGNNLYIATLALNSGSIYKLDWTENNPTASVLVDNIDRPQGITINQNYLYVCLNSNNPANDKIVRIDLNQSNPIPEDFIILDNPNGIVFRNNIMYVSSRNKIFYIDTEDSNPIPVEIINDVNVDAFGTIGLCIIDNFLFVSEPDKIIKYDINLSNPTKEIVVTGLSYVNGITKHTDEKLFFVSYSPDMIYELDIISETFTALFPSELTTVWDITNTNDFIFVSSLEGGEVNKIDISLLSVDDFNNQDVIIHPNPTSDIIKFNNVEEIKKAIIFNNLGQKVIESEIEIQGEIDIHYLSKGTYYLKIGNKKAVKFIKN